ncbi:TPA: YjdF family protein [Clostridium botulinum]|nr:YjdF family protein [Clostridium botulinum]HCL4560959.1 YjdF family protein [Clostridium botulinum]HCL4568810.1 YjdF family protein [Clostridium botulinum]HCL4571726.1 YjdF family protein [Clostridium botulinum]HCL4582652.1 YjdF family protein [Clostridium botulinum]
MIKLTVLFDEPFWIGIFEKQDQDKIQICRVVFGQEPKDYEVYDFILKNYYNLKFSNPIAIDKNPKKEINPKRMQRKIKKTVQENGIGTKAQQVLKLDYENKKTERKIRSKEDREKLKKLKIEKRQQKKAKKKKGH